MYEISFSYDDFDDPLVEKLTTLSFDLIKEIEFDSFGAGCRYPFPDEDKREELKKTFQFRLFQKLKEKISKELHSDNPDIFFYYDFKTNKLELKIKPIYLFGRYNKFKRDISQTLFYCRKCKGRGCNACDFKGHTLDQSVETLMGGVVKSFFDSGEETFHGAGREDVDVLMLGKGRPFVLEVKNPKKRNVDLQIVEKEINNKNHGKIVVSELSFTDKHKIVKLKSAEYDKLYSAKVKCDSQIDYSKIEGHVGKKLLIEQRTPNRVAKRRADLIRKRAAIIKKIFNKQKNSFDLELQTTSGTYVKEFISGDKERTKPSISSILGAVCVCKQLDVLEILDFFDY